MQQNWRQVTPQQTIPLKWLRGRVEIVDTWQLCSGEITEFVARDPDGNHWLWNDWSTCKSAVLMERTAN